MFRRDERAQAIQVAAIVLFGVVVVTFSLYQANVVPADAAMTEYEHSQRVQTQLLGLRTSIHATAETGNSYPVSVPLGTSYRARLVAVNPPAPSGRLASHPEPNVTLSNLTTSDGEAPLVGGIEYRTRSVSYRPEYNAYGSAPVTRYGATVLYDTFDDGATIARSNQTLLSGDTISLPLLRGRLNTTGAGTATLDPNPLSTPASTVPVTGDGTGPVTVTVPTAMPNASWQPLLTGELQANGGNLRGYDCTDPETGQPRSDTEPCGLLTLELDPDVEYALAVAVVGVGSTDEVVGREAYVVATAGNDTVVPEGGRQRVVVQVRDRFNNPVSGITVSAATDNESANDTITAEAVTMEDGRATLVYAPPENVSNDITVETEVWFDGERPNGDFSSPKNLKLVFEVVDTDGGGGDGGGPPGLPAIAVEWSRLRA